MRTAQRTLGEVTTVLASVLLSVRQHEAVPVPRRTPEDGSKHATEAVLLGG